MFVLFVFGLGATFGDAQDYSLLCYHRLFLVRIRELFGAKKQIQLTMFKTSALPTIVSVLALPESIFAVTSHYFLKCSLKFFGELGESLRCSRLTFGSALEITPGRDNNMR